MKAIEILSSRFQGRTIENPVAESDFLKVESKWQRKIPPALRELLLECNGIGFDSDVYHGDHQVMTILPLWGGIDSTLRTDGDYLGPSALPFAYTLTCDYFCLMSDGAVYVSNTFSSPDLDELRLDRASENFLSFIKELKER